MGEGEEGRTGEQPDHQRRARRGERGIGEHQPFPLSEPRESHLPQNDQQEIDVDRRETGAECRGEQRVPRAVGDDEEEVVAEEIQDEQSEDREDRASDGDACTEMCPERQSGGAQRAPAPGRQGEQHHHQADVHEQGLAHHEEQAEEGVGPGHAESDDRKHPDRGVHDGGGEDHDQVDGKEDSGIGDERAVEARRDQVLLSGVGHGHFGGVPEEFQSGVDGLGVGGAVSDRLGAIEDARAQLAQFLLLAGLAAEMGGDFIQISIENLGLCFHPVPPPPPVRRVPG